MSSGGLARHETLESTERWIAVLQRQAETLARSKLVPSAFQGADHVDDIVAVGLTLAPLGVDLTLNTLKHCFVLDGSVNFSAQLQISLMRSRGHAMRFDPECDERAAGVQILLLGEDQIHSCRYTIETARRAHLLDEWVERWASTQAGKRYPERITVAVDGAPVEGLTLPEWARKDLEAGRVKHKDPWFAAREAMLMCRVATKAIGKICPEVLLGIGDFAGGPAAPIPQEHSSPGTGGRETFEDDDDIDDAEVIDVHGSHTGEPHGVSAPPSDDDDAPFGGDGGPAAAARPTDGPVGQDHGDGASESVSALEDQGVTGEPTAAATPVPPGPPLVGAGWVQRLAIACRDKGLDREQRMALVNHAVGRATGRCVASSKEVMQGEEAAAVGWWFAELKAGRAEVRGTQVVSRWTHG